MDQSTEDRIFVRVLKSGKYGLEGLKVWEIIELQEVYKIKKSRAFDWCCGMVNINPNYNYPEEYRNGKELNYWLEKDPNYRNAEYVLNVINDFLLTVAKRKWKTKGRQSKRIDFIDLITNEAGYKEKYKNELRQNFINEFSDYDGVSLAKLFKSLEALGFFKAGYESNPKRTIYLAIKKEFDSEPKNERGFTLKDIEADKNTLEKLKEIGFDKLQNIK